MQYGVKDSELFGKTYNGDFDDEYTLYVNKNGSDDNTGTIGSPFLTIEYANNYAIANIPAWPIRVMICVSPGLYAGEQITQAHYRVHISGLIDYQGVRERGVVLANLGTGPSTYPLAVSDSLNMENITIATMDAIYYDYAPGIFGTLMGMATFTNCSFRGGYFVEQELVDAADLVMDFRGCHFNCDAFKIPAVVRNFTRFIALRDCDISGGTASFESTGTGSKTVKLERTMVASVCDMKGVWSTIFDWSEIYSTGRLIFDTDGFIDLFSSVLINGVHFTTDSIMSKKCVNCIFKDTPVGEGDMTAGESIEFIEYSGNHQHNGIDGEIITVSKIKNVGGGQNKYRTIHEALQGSSLTDTIINLEGDIEVSEPLIVNPNIDVQIDGNKKWKLTSSHATTLVTLGANQQLSFVNMKQVTGGKKVIINGNGASVSFVSCGRYTQPNYVNIEINAGDGSSFVYLVKTNIIGTGAPAILVSDIDPWLIMERTFVQGAANEAAVEWTVDADSKFKAKFSTFLHGAGGTDAFISTVTNPNDITISVYDCAFNSSWDSNDFTNSINSVNANLTVDAGIDF